MPRKPRGLDDDVPLPQTGVWSTLLEASYDRDDALRAARPIEPSTSKVPCRCHACREWSRADAGRCIKCGCPWVPDVPVGLPRMGDAA